MNFSFVGLLISAIGYLVDFIRIVILIRVVLSWVPMSRGNAFSRIVYTLSEPILAPIRRLIYNSPLGRGGLFIDFSPYIAIILMQFLKIILITLILNIAKML